jgi:hypothetical protein
VVLACCAGVVGCDLTPSVLFVADGSPVRLLQLTDAQGECPARRRVSFLATWDGQTVRGCWMREEVNVRVPFQAKNGSCRWVVFGLPRTLSIGMSRWTSGAVVGFTALTASTDPGDVEAPMADIQAV